MSIQSELKAFKEITSWDECKHPVLNHTYILNNQGHCVGFRSTKTKKYKKFSKPMKQFSKSRRKFIELKPVEKYMSNG